MRLELFEIMDDATIKLKERQDKYLESELRILQCFKSLMGNQDESVVEYSSRIKTETSLREKIIRNKLYHSLKSGEEILDSLHDLIGITIKCQFIKEEKELYNEILKQFNNQNYDGFFYNDKFPNILLNLQMTQPQQQKNGFKIYRIDGYCRIGEFKANFELQLKAMVYTFWSEIEHKIVYKNNNYSLNNIFITDLLDSIRNSLGSIDSQLNIIYNEMQFQNGKKRTINDRAMKNVIAKSINDLFIGKIQDSIGFTINFKKTCDIMSEFFYNREIDDFTINEKTIILRIGARIEALKERDIDFETPFIFDKDIESDDRFVQIMSKAFLFNMNSDFEWYVFFKILFEILPANNVEDLEIFINVFKQHFFNDETLDYVNNVFNEFEATSITNDIMTLIALTLVEVDDISILHEDKINLVVSEIEEFCRIFIIDVKDFEKWESTKNEYLNKLKERVLLVFN